jgi:hypothetical protein
MSNALEPRASVCIFTLGDRLGPTEFSAYLAELDRCIERGTPFAMLIDGSHPKLALAELSPRPWQVERIAALGRLHRGAAFVAGSMTHERIRALYVLQPPGVPYGFFAATAEALEWAHGALDGAPRSTISRRKTQPIMTAISS